MFEAAAPLNEVTAARKGATPAKFNVIFALLSCCPQGGGKWKGRRTRQATGTVMERHSNRLRPFLYNSLHLESDQG